VRRLLATGTPPAELQLLLGRPTRDVRDQPIGGFAGPIAPDALVGTFAGRAVPRRHAAGDWIGAPAGRRQGSFGDAERDELVSFDESGREVHRTVDRRVLRRPLRSVAADRADSDRLIAELHEGHALLLRRAQSESGHASLGLEDHLLAA
jgi:hypothetical protein